MTEWVVAEKRALPATWADTETGLLRICVVCPYAGRFYTLYGYALHLKKGRCGLCRKANQHFVSVTFVRYLVRRFRALYGGKYGQGAVHAVRYLERWGAIGGRPDLPHMDWTGEAWHVDTQLDRAKQPHRFKGRNHEPNSTAAQRKSAWLAQAAQGATPGAARAPGAPHAEGALV